MIKKLIVLGILSVSAVSFAQKISISPSVGYAWRLAKTSPDLTRQQEEYIKGLKSGVNFDVALRYQVTPGLLIGFKYSGYSASTDGRFSVSDGMGHFVSANITTKDNINFYGPELTLTNDVQETRHKFFMSAALGAMTYTSKTGTVKAKGTTFGAELDFAYQYQITKNLLIGPKLGLSGGTLSKVSSNGRTIQLEDGQKEGLTRLSLSAAATFRF